jgi:hypothetical protein
MPIFSTFLDLTIIMMKFERPHLKIEQPESAFAEGNARWTNKDLDPVPRNKRKWGAVSFIAYWISLVLSILSRAVCLLTSSSHAATPSMLQPGSSPAVSSPLALHGVNTSKLSQLASSSFRLSSHSMVQLGCPTMLYSTFCHVLVGDFGAPTLP